MSDVQPREKSSGRLRAQQRRATARKGGTADASGGEGWPKTWTFAIGASLLLAVLALYSPVVGHPFINYDDTDYVTGNQHVQAGLSWQTLSWALSSTEAANWHPLTWLSHALDCQMYGLNAGGHHATSLLFHALNTVMLFLLLARATGARGRAAFVAALFGLHPFSVESVAWIAERKNVLSMFFFLLTLGAYGWYAGRPNLRRYAVVVALFIAALASKPMVVSLPFVLLLLDYWPLGRVQGWVKPSTTLSVVPASPARLVVEKLPLLVLSAASAVITIVAQQSGEAVESLGDLSFRIRLENAAYSYAVYVAKILWPVNFSVIYPHPLDKLTVVQVFLSLSFLTIVSAWVWRERVRRPYLITGWFWFLGTLVPVIGIVQVGGQGMADRYAYLPTIGIFLMLVWRGAEWGNEHSVKPWVAPTVAAVILATLSVLTFRQIKYWQSSYDLWTHALEVTEENFIADDGMADVLLKQGRPEALRYYEAAARIAPWDPVSHTAVAASLQDRGEFQGAIREYEIALRAKPSLKSQAFAYANLGVIYRQLGDYSRARESSDRALRADSVAVHEFIGQLSQVVAARPAAPGYLRLGLLQEGAGRIAEARSAYKQALRLNPEFVPASKALAAMGENQP